MFSLEIIFLVLIPVVLSIACVTYTIIDMLEK